MLVPEAAPGSQFDVSIDGGGFLAGKGEEDLEAGVGDVFVYEHYYLWREAVEENGGGFIEVSLCSLWTVKEGGGDGEALGKRCRRLFWSCGQVGALPFRHLVDVERNTVVEQRQTESSQGTESGICVAGTSRL